MVKKILFAVIAGVLSIGGAAHAGAFIDTGYKAGGGEIPLGTTAPDGNWTITGGSGTGVPSPLPQPVYASAINGQFPIDGYWLPDNSVSRWVTPSAVVGQTYDPNADGTYQFTETFNLTAAEVHSTYFTGQFTSDNFVDGITVNGDSIYSATPDGSSNYPVWTSFGDTNHTGFHVGTNTLTFDVVNYAQNGGNPAGLNVEFLSSAVPEPATWAMMLFGFFGLGAMARASRRTSARMTAVA